MIGIRVILSHPHLRYDGENEENHNLKLNGSFQIIQNLYGLVSKIKLQNRKETPI